MLDHFSEGRIMPRFARGYQARHVGTMGQKYNAYWTSPNDPQFAEHDRVNRELFTEHYEIIRKAWREPLFKHVGQHWELPPTGIDWNHPATKDMAPGMVGADGKLVQVGIAPQTLQDPEAIEIYIPCTMSPTHHCVGCAMWDHPSHFYANRSARQGLLGSFITRPRPKPVGLSSGVAASDIFPKSRWPIRMRKLTPSWNVDAATSGRADTIGADSTKRSGAPMSRARSRTRRRRFDLWFRRYSCAQT